jgi:hypothetical protein
MSDNSNICNNGLIYDPITQKCYSIVCPEGNIYDSVTSTCIPSTPSTSSNNLSDINSLIKSVSYTSSAILNSPSSSEIIKILNDIRNSSDLILKKNILNSLSVILQTQNTINIIPVYSPSIINSLYTYYSEYNSKINTNLPIFLATSINNSDNIQQFDFSKLSIDVGSGLNLILPLDEGKSILVDDVKITRGNLTDGTTTNQTNQISIDNINWLNYDAKFSIGMYTYTFLSSGSPILIEITNKLLIRTLDTSPSTISTPDLPWYKNWFIRT